MTTPSGLPTVRLKKTTRLSHPWVFARGIEKPETRIPPGSVADLVQPDGSFAARGFYNHHSRIGFRILTQNPTEQIDGDFVRRRLLQAVEWRRHLGLFNEEKAVMRLVHGEGDGLSGLVVDLYDNVIAIEWFSAGMFRLRDVIRRTLADLFPGAAFYWFAEKRIQKQESFDCWDMPPPAPVTVHENSLKFRVDIGSMHKTGYFADQRDNRLLLTSHTKGKSVLDLCCHSGGFSVYSKTLGNARKVVGVDLDPLALDVARANATLNHADITFEQADVYEWLKNAIARKERFDVVILDPAKQTRSQEGVDGALAQYVAMNRLAMEVVSEGGILLTCSCSGLVTEDQFQDTIRRAASHAGKNAQIFRLSGAAPDHPWLADVPESRYLKAIWARVSSKNMIHEPTVNEISDQKS